MCVTVLIRIVSTGELKQFLCEKVKNVDEALEKVEEKLQRKVELVEVLNIPKED